MAAKEVPHGFSADAGPGPNVVLRSVSCSSPGDCTAVGEYSISTQTDGVWGPTVQLSTANGLVDTLAVSCVAPGDCTAVGADGTLPTYAVETDGVWADPVEIAATEIAKPGTFAPPDSIAQMRLLNTVSSADARVSDPIQGVLTEPLFEQHKQLVLPQGTRFTGKVTSAQRARLFHRGGKLRFTIDSVDLPREETAALEAASARTEHTSQAVQGQLVLGRVRVHGGVLRRPRRVCGQASSRRARPPAVCA